MVDSHRTHQFVFVFVFVFYNQGRVGRWILIGPTKAEACLHLRWTLCRRKVGRINIDGTSFEFFYCKKIIHVLWSAIAFSIFWTFLSGAPFKNVLSCQAPSFSFIAPCAHLLEGPNHPEGVDRGPRRGGLMVRSFIILVSFLILILILVLIISLIMLFLLLLPPLILLLLIIFILAIAGKFLFQPMRSA